MEELLDATSPPKRYIKLTDFITVFLVLLLFIWKGYNYLVHSHVFEMESALAFLAVGIATALYFVNRSFYIYILLFVFCIGTLGFFHFTPEKIIVTVRILRFNPISMLLLIVHLFTFYQTFEIRRTEGIKEGNRSQIDSFKSKFSDKSVHELQEILNSNGFRSEAKQAAAELLKEKT